VVGLLSGDDWSVGSQREMDPGVGHQVGLELGQIDVQSTVESERSGDGRDNLSHQPVQVGVGGSLDVQVSSANVVDGFVVDHEGTVRVLQGGMGGQDGVVGLNNGGGDLRGRVDGELKLGLLAVVYGQTLQKERSEAGSGTSSEGVEDQESLKSTALVSDLPEAVKALVNNLLSDGVVTTGVVVGGIFLASDQLLGVEELSVGSSPHFINDSWFQVEEDGTGNVFASSSRAEEGVESIITSTDGLVRRHLTIRLDTVLETVQFPAGITDLDSGLSEMNRNALSHD